MQHCPHEISTYVYRIDCTTANAHFHYRVLPLHCASMRNPPALIISALISAFPEAGKTKPPPPYPTQSEHLDSLPIPNPSRLPSLYKMRR